MNALGDLDVKEWKISDTQMLRLSTKSAEGKLYLDARKWLKNASNGEYFPSKKGLMLEINEWKHTIPLITELLEANSKT